MSACTHLCKVFELIFFISVCWARRNCSSKSTSDFIREGETAKDLAFGDCSFKETLCNYTQACTDSGAMNWTIKYGTALCPGNSITYDSFSILTSPLLNIDQNTSLAFRYFQQPPATLSVFLITRTDITQVLPEVGSIGSFHKLLFIGPSTLKIEFKARTVRETPAYTKVTLSNVKLQVVSYTSTPNHVTTKATSFTYSQPSTHLSTQADHVTTKAASSTHSQPSTHLSTQADSMTAIETSPTYSQPSTHLSTQAEPTDNPEGAEDKTENNAVIVAGVIVPVIVVVVVGVVVAIFIWRRHKQKLHGSFASKGIDVVGNAGTEDEGTAKVNRAVLEKTGSETQHTNHYDVMNFEAASDDVHVYQSIRT